MPTMAFSIINKIHTSSTTTLQMPLDHGITSLKTDDNFTDKTTCRRTIFISIHSGCVNHTRIPDALDEEEWSSQRKKLDRIFLVTS